MEKPPTPLVVYVVHDSGTPLVRRGFRTKREALSFAGRVGKSCNVFRYELPRMSVKAAWNVGAQGLEDAVCLKVERLER